MHNVSWESVKFNGKGPGKISHHTASVVGEEVCFYGGLQGSDSLATIFLFAPATSAWTRLNEPAGIIARDDHALSSCDDGTFLTFGGFVNGSRSNEVCHFSKDGNALNGKTVSEGSEIPARAGHTTVHYQGKLFVFGGTDDDNDKLGDLWCHDMTSNTCKQICSEEGEVIPVARSGHTATICGTQMFVFGGILELTKELNDLSVFDFTTEKWIRAVEDPFAEEKEKQKAKEAEAAAIAEAEKKGSPFKRMQTMGPRP